MDTYTVNLPLPLPLNRTYRSGRGYFYKSKEAKAWTEECLWIMKPKNGIRKPFEGKVYVNIIMQVERDRDIDSGIKAVLDLLQEARIYSNDSQVTYLTVTKIKQKGNPGLSVSVCLWEK